MKVNGGTAVRFLFGLSAMIAGCDAPDVQPEADETSAWEEAWEAKQGKADFTGCSGVQVPDRGGFGKRVALTFDDGPNPETTPQILDILAARDIQATFFINGKRVNSEPAEAVLRRIVDEGHILANHSESHLKMTSLPPEEVRSEIAATHNLIAELTEPLWFRFPFGASNCDTMAQVEAMGLTATGWHVDSADWCFASGVGGVGVCDARTFVHVPDAMRHDMAAFTMDQTRRNDGGIVLFHDIHANTANSLEAIIDTMAGESFTFVTIDDVATFPALNDVQNDRGFVGDACSADEDVCDFAVGQDEGACHEFGDDFGFCTLPCAGTCPDLGGRAPTFCVALDDESGSCVSRADDRNDQCAAIPGTVAELRPRFVGDSGFAETSAMVCVPEI